MLLGKQLFDDGFCFIIGTLADMAVTENALLVHQDNGRPSPHAKALPNAVVVVLDDGEFDSQPARCVGNFVKWLLPGKLR